MTIYHLALASVAVVFGSCCLVAAWSLAASRLKSRRTAELARRRAVHPATRDVTKRTVHIAPESPALWREFDYWNTEDAR